MDTAEHPAIVVPIGTPWASHPARGPLGPEPVRLDFSGPSHRARYLLGSVPDSGLIDWDADEPWTTLDTRTGRLVVDQTTDDMA